MKIKQIKTVKPNRHLFRKIFALLFSVVVVVISFIVITNANKDAKDTVEVLRIKTTNGMPAFTVLTENDIESYSLIRKEFVDSMIEISEKAKVINKFSKYYLRQGSYLYEDEFTAEKPQKNEWLYVLDEETEVLTLPYNFLECGGDILMPGDRVRIRVTYESEKLQTDSYENPNLSGGSNETVTKVDILFNSIVVKDMLNSNSHSIYEVYKEVLKLSEDKKLAVMKSDDFLRNIQPKALLLEGTKEQIDMYAKYKGLDGNAFLITILSRSNSDVILDQLPTLEKEVESWIDQTIND